MVFLSFADARGMRPVLDALEGDGAVDAGELGVGATVEVLVKLRLLDCFLASVADKRDHLEYM